MVVVGLLFEREHPKATFDSVSFRLWFQTANHLKLISLKRCPHIRSLCAEFIRASFLRYVQKHTIDDSFGKSTAKYFKVWPSLRAIYTTSGVIKTFVHKYIYGTLLYR